MSSQAALIINSAWRSTINDNVSYSIGIIKQSST